MRKILLLCLLIGSLCSCGGSADNSRWLLSENKRLQARVDSLELELAAFKDKARIEEQIKLNAQFEVVGRWLDNRPGADTQIILKKEIKTGKYYLIHKFKDGSSSEEKASVTKSNGLRKIREIGSSHVEWYIIEKNGDLSMYSQNGKFGTALCL